VTGSGYETREDALAALASARSDANVTGGRGRGKTVHEWLLEWLDIDAGTEDEKSITTLARHRGNINNHIIPVLGDIKLTKLTVDDVRRLMTTLRDPRYQSPVLLAKDDLKAAKKHGLSSASINRVHEALHAALERAVRDRLITWNPADHVKPPREQNLSYGSWSPAHTAAFLDLPEVRDHGGYAAWHCALVTGVRRGELAAPYWHDIDLDDAVWELRENLVQVGGTTKRKGTKSAAGTRLVYLDRETVAVFRAHRRQQLEVRLSLGPRWQELPHTHPETDQPCDCGGPVSVRPAAASANPTGSLITGTRWSRLLFIGFPACAAFRCTARGTLRCLLRPSTPARQTSRRSNGSATPASPPSAATVTSTKNCTARSRRRRLHSSPNTVEHDYLRRMLSSARVRRNGPPRFALLPAVCCPRRPWLERGAC
jgi:integrase